MLDKLSNLLVVINSLRTYVYSNFNSPILILKIHRFKQKVQNYGILKMAVVLYKCAEGTCNLEGVKYLTSI